MTTVTEPQTAVQSLNQLALDLYAHFRSQPGNLFLSPFSVATALAMTSAGARGQTAQEMARILGYPAEPERVHPAFASLIQAVNAGDARPFELHTANALWGQQGYGFLTGFLDQTRTYYGAGLHEVDFADATEAARRTINAWVEAQTRDRIQELLKESAVKPDTRLVLTNAIYFKGDWAIAFPKKDTRDGPFHAPGGDVDVPLMHLKGEFAHLDGDTFQMLELPYRGADAELSMQIFLPKTAGGLTAFEQALTLEKLAEWQPWPGCEVTVTLPRFKTTREVELNDPLSKLGMSSAFGSSADFSGMNGRRDLYIDTVVHQAFVEVNEEGTEAAAATGVVIRMISMPPPPAVFCADRPFFFLIRHNPTGAILFLGRLVQPGR